MPGGLPPTAPATLGSWSRDRVFGILAYIQSPRSPLDRRSPVYFAVRCLICCRANWWNAQALLSVAHVFNLFVESKSRIPCFSKWLISHNYEKNTIKFVSIGLFPKFKPSQRIVEINIRLELKKNADTKLRVFHISKGCLLGIPLLW